MKSSSCDTQCEEWSSGDWNWYDSSWDLVELIPASIATYGLGQHESDWSLVGGPMVKDISPSPCSDATTAIMHAAVSFSAVSFLHRRQDRDEDQTGILAVCAGVGAMLGVWQGVSLEDIMTVHMSWAVCATMVLSVVNYRCRATGVGEKLAKLATFA